MKQSILALLFLFLLSSANSFSQILKGKVVNQSNEPVAGASLFINETKQGLACNADGDFQIKLDPGTYHCEFSCMGYYSEEKTVTVLKEDTELQIVLKEKDFKLSEVVITNGEDPAYEIMRKTIAKAPFYQSVIKQSTYEAYSKGSGKLLTMPKIYESLMDKEDKAEINTYKEKLLVQESFSEITFTAPDQYTQTVKAFSSTIPGSTDPEDAFGTSMLSLYQPNFGYAISPLNPKAFTHYRFRYEGFDEEDGQVINIIKVIPKLSDSRFLEGYLYIADDEWNIRHAILTSHQAGATVHYTFNYHPVIGNIYLVTNYEMKVEAGLLGIKFNADFLASIKYTDIQLNDSLIALENSLQKIDLKKKEKPKSLEIKYEDPFKKTIDSLAIKRDSRYWDQVRSIVLSEEETASYARKDTLKARQDSLDQKKYDPKFSWGDIIVGGRIGGDTAKVSFKYGGLLRAFPEYNFVDGTWAGQSVDLIFRPNKRSEWKINPRAYWAWSRERLLWEVNTSYTYAPMRAGLFWMEGGSTSKDYVNNKGMLRIENTIYTLFAGVNNAKLYQKDYFRMGNQIDISNGLLLMAEIEIADRNPLDNHTDYSFFGKKEDIKPNRPDYSGSLNSQYNSLMQYTIGVSYTPEYYYSVDNGKKRYRHSRFPTFKLQFQQGVPSWLDNSTFYRLEVGIEQTIKLGLFDRLAYSVNAGKFLNDNAFNYIDYKHFNSGDQLFTGKVFDPSQVSAAFALLDYYGYSTNRNWIQAHVAYNTQYLLLKRIPFLQGKLFGESLHGKFLRTPDKPCYTEWGYSVGLPENIASFGAFVSFDSFQYNSFGLRISFPILLFMNTVK